MIAMMSGSYETNGYKSPHAYQNTYSKATAMGVNGSPVSASSLLDPKAIRSSRMNGELKSFSCHATPALSHRCLSEPPCALVPLYPAISHLKRSRDDTDKMLERQEGKENASRIDSNNSKPLPSFDPRQLLNPKRYNVEKRQKEETANDASYKNSCASTDAPDFVFAAPGAEDDRATSPGRSDSGMGNLIERVHNVEKRQERPQKKRKIEHMVKDDEDKPKSTFAGGGKGGEIGEFMRQKRKEAQADFGPSSTVVDLTAGGFVPISPQGLCADTIL